MPVKIVGVVTGPWENHMIEMLKDLQRGLQSFADKEGPGAYVVHVSPDLNLTLFSVGEVPVTEIKMVYGNTCETCGTGVSPGSGIEREGILTPLCPVCTNKRLLNQEETHG